MNIKNFKEIVTKTKHEHPVWFGLEPDNVANDDDIYNAEEKLNVTLPSEYKEFIKAFGGGYFAFSIIYSLDVSSEWNLINQNQKYSSILKNHIIISENECGDFYGFYVVDNECTSKIFFYDHEVEEWKSTKFPNFFNFLIENALTA